MKKGLIQFTSNKKLNKNINMWVFKVIDSLQRDFMEWLFFTGRLIYNAFLLFFFMKFIRAFWMFTFMDNGVVDPKHLDIIPKVLWAIGLIWLIVIMFRRNKNESI